MPSAAAIQKILTEEVKYAFVGVSCQIHAMRKAEALFPKPRDKIAVYLGIHCENTLSTHFTDMILECAKVKRDEVKRFAFRSKNWRSWPGDMQVETHTGKTIDIPGRWRQAVSKPFYVPWRCMVCPDKLNDFSDISFGDCRVPRIYGKQKISEAHYGGNLGQSDKGHRGALVTLVERKPLVHRHPGGPLQDG